MQFHFLILYLNQELGTPSGVSGEMGCQKGLPCDSPPGRAGLTILCSVLHMLKLCTRTWAISWGQSLQNYL